MASASDGTDVGRSQTAITDSSNGVLLPSTEVQPGAPGSNPEQQPQAQQPGSNPDSAAQTEGVQSTLSSQQGQEASEVADPDDISDAQWNEATRGAHYSDAEEPEQSDEGDWEDDESEEGTSLHPSPAPSREELERAFDEIANESRDQTQATFSAAVQRLNQRPEQQRAEATDHDGDASMANNVLGPAPDARPGTTDNAPPAPPAGMDIDNEAQPTIENPFEQKKVKCKSCKGRHVPPCNPDIVAANQARKGEKQPATSSSKKRASEDADPEQPEQPSQPKRNRRAEGLPWNWCYTCQEEHPRADADGTTHHTKTADDAMRLRNEQRRRAAESAGNTAAAAAQNPLQAPPQPPQSSQGVLRTMAEMPISQKAFEVTLKSMDNDTGRINGLLALFDETREAASSQLTAPPPVPASVAHTPYANAATGLPQGTYNFPSAPQAPWPSQPPRGRGRGRGGRGRGSAHSGQTTAQNSAANAAPAAPAQATNVAPSALNGAQTGQTGQPPRSNHQSAGPAGSRGGRGRDRGEGRGRGGSA